MRSNTTVPAAATKQRMPPSTEKPSPRHVRPVGVMRQASLEEMTPLQRQRLDTAVMMLVKYLVSASASDT